MIPVILGMGTVEWCGNVAAGDKIKFNTFSLYATVPAYERPNCHVASTTLKLVLSNINNEREYQYKFKQVSPTPHRQSACLPLMHNTRMAVRWWPSAGKVHLPSLWPWPWKPFQQCPLTRWIFVPSFTEFPPLNTEIQRYHVTRIYKIGVNGQTENGRLNGQT